MMGNQINRYEINEEIGRGGMAIVYKAFDPDLARHVAIKVIRKESIPEEKHDQLRKRFQIEATAQAGFDHPHIVPVYDFGEVEDMPYLVMAYRPAGTLKDKVRGRMDYREAAGILAKVANALAYAHKRGVLHRDVKPSNILISEDGSPALTDFGIAMLIDQEDKSRLTRTGFGVGTAEYMAPEQWKGEAFEQTDVYALGVVLYELITGTRPYEADTPHEIAIKQATEPIQRPVEMVKDLPPEVERVLFKALALKPEDRYPSMKDLAAELLALGQGLTSTAPEKPVHQCEETETYDALELGPATGKQPKIGNMLWLWILGGLGILGLCSLAIFAITQFPPSMKGEATSTLEMAAAGFSTSDPGGDTIETIGEDVGTEEPEAEAPAPSPEIKMTATTEPVRKNSEPMLVYAYGPFDNTEIYIYYINSGKKEQITNNNYEDKGPSFSGDNSKIVYASNRDKGWELYVLDLATRKETRITNFDGEAKFPNWSPIPGDDRIVFEGRQGVTGRFDINVFMVSGDGSGVNKIEQLTFSNADNRPTWTGDGKKIIFGRATNDDSGDGRISASDYLDIFALDMETAKIEQVTKTGRRDEFQFSGSPDGYNIFYVASSQDLDKSGFLNLDDNRDLHMIDIYGGNYQRIDMPNYPIYSPSWSPDGRYLSFTIWFNDDESAIWLYDLNKEKIVELTGKGPFYHPEWNN